MNQAFEKSSPLKGAGTQRVLWWNENLERLKKETWGTIQDEGSAENPLKNKAGAITTTPQNPLPRTQLR